MFSSADHENDYPINQLPETPELSPVELLYGSDEEYEDPFNEFTQTTEPKTAEVPYCYVTRSTCKWAFKTQEEVAMHVKRTHNYCSRCDLYFYDLIKHEQETHLETDGYRCICYDKFLNASSLFLHIEQGRCEKMKAHVLYQLLLCHRENEPGDKPKDTLARVKVSTFGKNTFIQVKGPTFNKASITIAGLKGPLFDNPGKALREWRDTYAYRKFVIEGKETFYCVACREAFPSRAELKKHLHDNQVPSRPFTATCEYCAETSSTFAHMVKHLEKDCGSRKKIYDGYLKGSNWIRWYQPWGGTMYADIHDLES